MAETPSPPPAPSPPPDPQAPPAIDPLTAAGHPPGGPAAHLTPTGTTPPREGPNVSTAPQPDPGAKSYVFSVDPGVMEAAIAAQAAKLHAAGAPGLTPVAAPAVPVAPARANPNTVTNLLLVVVLFVLGLVVWKQFFAPVPEPPSPASQIDTAARAFLMNISAAYDSVRGKVLSGEVTGPAMQIEALKAARMPAAQALADAMEAVQRPATDSSGKFIDRALAASALERAAKATKVDK